MRPGQATKNSQRAGNCFLGSAKNGLHSATSKNIEHCTQRVLPPVCLNGDCSQSGLAREPDSEKVVVDDVVHWGTIDQILVNGFHQRLLIVCEEIYQFFVLHGTLIDNMKDCLVDLYFTAD